MNLTAHAPLPSLLTSLARAGWGPLSGGALQGVRSTLTALVSQLPHGSGEGTSTAEQVALAAGLSGRWVRECLKTLEDLGLVTWTRGGVIAGKPAPSHFRINKRAVVALILEARPIKAAREAARAAATTERLKTLRTGYVRGGARGLRVPGKRAGQAMRNSRQAPTPYGEGPRAVPARPTPTTSIYDWKAEAAKAAAAAVPPPRLRIARNGEVIRL